MFPLNSMRLRVLSHISAVLSLTVVCVCAVDALGQQNSLLDAHLARDGAFLDAVETQQALVTQVIQASVAQQLSDARKSLGTPRQSRS